MELTSLDLCGSYPVTQKANRYLVTYIDHFTRYPEAIPIPNQEAETVARALVTQVFTRHSCPQVLSSDRGTNFMSALFQEMCKLLQVKRISSTAFNPKMQGKVERFHAGLNQATSHYVNKYGNDWDDYVDYALKVHRATPHSVTKYSPYYLFYGRDMRLPNMADLSARMEASEEKHEAQDRVTGHIQTLAGKLSEAYEVVRKLNKIGREKQKAHYDKNTKLVTFSVGDYVCLKEMAVGAGMSRKFRNHWRGPYLIAKRFSDLNYQIQIKPGKYMTVNVNRLKKCQEGEKIGNKQRQPLKRNHRLTSGAAVMNHCICYCNVNSYQPLGTDHRDPKAQRSRRKLYLTTRNRAITTPLSLRKDGEIVDTPSHDRSRSEVTPSSETQGVTNPQEGHTVDGERNGSYRGQPYSYFLRPYQLDETMTRVMSNLGLAGFVYGQGRTPDLDKGLVFLYHQDLIVTGNFWNVVVNLDLKWYRSQLDLIGVILAHVENYQKNPGQGMLVAV
jgi:hypothetical protein